MVQMIGIHIIKYPSQVFNLNTKMWFKVTYQKHIYWYHIAITINLSWLTKKSMSSKPLATNVFSYWGSPSLSSQSPILCMMAPPVIYTITSLNTKKKSILIYLPKFGEKTIHQENKKTAQIYQKLQLKSYFDTCMLYWQKVINILYWK